MEDKLQAALQAITKPNHQEEGIYYIKRKMAKTDMVEPCFRNENPEEEDEPATLPQEPEDEAMLEALPRMQDLPAAPPSDDEDVRDELEIDKPEYSALQQERTCTDQQLCHTFVEDDPTELHSENISFHKKLIDINEKRLNILREESNKYYEDREIKVFEPVAKEVEGELDHVQQHTNYNYRDDERQRALSEQLPIQNFANLVPFPTDFRTPEDALTAYNDYGLWHGIQFKIRTCKWDRDQSLQLFELVCACRRVNVFRQVKQGVALQKKDIYNDCPVYVRFWYQHDRGIFKRMNKMMMHHTHPLELNLDNMPGGDSIYQNSQIVKEIHLYVDSGVQPSQIHELLVDKYHMNISFEEVYRAALQFQVGASHAEKAMDTRDMIFHLKELRRRDNRVRFAYEFAESAAGGDGTERFDRLLVQTAQMKRNYDLYHDTIFMDATYRTNYDGMALTIFTAVDNEGRNVIVAFALVQRETLDTYEWLLKKIASFNAGQAPRVLLTDFDPSMSGAIERCLPHTTHLLCQWHMQQNLKKRFLYLTTMKKENASRARFLYKYLTGDVIFNDSVRHFWKITEIIFSPQNKDLLGEDSIKYLRRLWLIKEKWTAAFAPKQFIAGTHTTSRGEAVNSMVKRTIHSRSTIVDILKTMQDLDDRVNERCEENERNAREEIYHHPLLLEMKKMFTSFVFEHQLFQFMNSHNYLVSTDASLRQKATKIGMKQGAKDTLQAGTYHARDPGEAKGFEVQVREIGQLNPGQGEPPFRKVSCTCRFYQAYNITCEHMMAVLSRCQVKSLKNLSIANERWTRRYQWEKFSEVDKTIMPLNPEVQRQILKLDELAITQMLNEDEAVAEKKFIADDEDTQIPSSSPNNFGGESMKEAFDKSLQPEEDSQAVSIQEEIIPKAKRQPKEQPSQSGDETASTQATTTLTPLKNGDAAAAAPNGSLLKKMSKGSDDDISIVSENSSAPKFPRRPNGLGPSPSFQTPLVKKKVTAANLALQQKTLLKKLPRNQKFVPLQNFNKPVIPIHRKPIPNSQDFRPRPPLHSKPPIYSSQGWPMQAPPPTPPNFEYSTQGQHPASQLMKPMMPPGFEATPLPPLFGGPSLGPPKNGI